MALSEPGTIAVIDDDESVRVAIGTLLESLGHSILAFPSAEAFLDSKPRDSAWCVVTDVRMPGMSGVELQALMRAQGNHVPFVFITAVIDERVRESALDGGATCILSKPVDEDLLIGCLERVSNARP